MLSPTPAARGLPFSKEKIALPPSGATESTPISFTGERAAPAAAPCADEPPRRGARSRGAPGHRFDPAGAEALSARQPALPDHGAGARRPGDAPDARAAAAELEKRRLPRAAAEGSVGKPLPVSESRPAWR